MGKTDRTTFLMGDIVPVYECDQCETEITIGSLHWEKKNFTLCTNCIEENYTTMFGDEMKRNSSTSGKKSIPQAIRELMLGRDNYQCRYCDSTEDLTADHVIPESRGGPSTIDNLATACRSCNSRKGARTPEEANMKLKRV